MKSRRIFTSAVVLALITTLIISGCAPKAESPSSGPLQAVKVAVIADLTGPYSPYAAPSAEGFKAYFDRLSEKGIGIEGAEVEVLLYDMGGKAPKGMEAMHQAAADGAITVFSSMASVVQPTINLAETYKLTHVCVSPGVTGLWSDWVYPFSNPSLSDIVAALLDSSLIVWEKQGKPGKPVIGMLIYDSLPGHVATMGFSKPCDGQSVPYVEQKGIEYVEEWFPMDATDLSPQIARLKRAGVDMILMGGTSTHVVAALRAMELQGLDASQLALVAIVDMADLLALAGADLFENVYIQSMGYNPFHEPGIEDPPGAIVSKELWEEKYPGEYLKNSFTWGIMGGTIVEEALRLALKEVSADELTGETFRDHGLNQITNFTAQGLIQPPGLNWRPGVGNHPGPCSFNLWQVRGGYTYEVVDHVECAYIYCKL